LKANIGRELKAPATRDKKRTMWLAAALILAFNALFAAFIFVEPVGCASFTTIVNVAEFVGPLLMLPLCFGGLFVQDERLSRGQRWAPVLLGLGILSFVIGQVYFAYYESVLHRAPPVPSFADADLLSQYPLLLLGILLLPAHAIPAASRTRIALDGLMVMTAAVTFSWYFVLGPIVEQGSESAVAKVVSLAYPLADIVLIASLLLASRPGEQALRPAIRLLALGLLIVVAADLTYAYQLLDDAYATGTILDVGWPFGYMLLGLGAYVARLAPAHETEATADGGAAGQGLWYSLLPYALVPVVGVLAVYAWRASAATGDQLATEIYIGGGFLVFLLLARQVLTIIENSRLYGRMEQKNDELVRSEDELRRQKEYSEALALNSPIAIATIDLDSKVVGWNPAAETLFGYASDEAIGRGLDSLVVGTPEMRAEVAEYTQRVSGDEQVSAITRRSRRDGTLVDVELLAVR